jgi:protein-L-isoaspartate(D-aspartate) O-methyltransferase
MVVGLSLAREKERLIQELKAIGAIRSKSVEEAFRRVPRELFLPEHLRMYAYMDTPLPIGSGQTISAPHMVCLMNEELQLEVGYKVLEVGAGSGYHACTIAEIVAPSDVDKSLWGHVWTLEIVEELASYARRNIEKAGYGDRVTVIWGDGSKGLPEYAPYDRILVTAAAPDVPQPLIDQLKPEGIILIPIGRPYSTQILVKVEKKEDGRVTRRRLLDVIFVPLKGEYGW